MKRRDVFIGDHPIRINEGGVEGGFTVRNGEKFFKISNYDLMPDFFMSIVSASDQWMFISSNGSLTAGRKNAQSALFPYYTEDKIHDFHNRTGSKTLILNESSGMLRLWEPFSKDAGNLYSIQRNIYKNQLGNKIVFEEVNKDLLLIFRYSWLNSDRFGFVKRSELDNMGQGTVKIEILDGLQNILPSGVDSGMQTGFSSLMDAYKKAELLADTGLGIYRLSSIPVDTAEPSESLKVNTVWSDGLAETKILLSSQQLDRFRQGWPVETEQEIKAEKGAYLLNATFKLSAGTGKEWHLVAEVDQDATDLAGLKKFLGEQVEIRKELEDDIDRCSEELLSLVASSDALQSTKDDLGITRHLTNVMFNVMRGGLFEDQYSIQRSDFIAFAEATNKKHSADIAKIFGEKQDRIPYPDLLEKSFELGDPELIRICYEYLPLSFSRRHGDPSRPWNTFSIDNRKDDGSRNLDYQGNWRDIFQNWEALSHSFPEYVESMISKFVNASTIDGFNPYRITRSGIDWEVPDPSDPWSNIGYWGDHQIIYLLKLLEVSRQYHPGRLKNLLTHEIFTYANVPYRIKPYKELLEDPHNTIDFDLPLEETIAGRIRSTGSDGKLVWGKTDNIVHVNLAEKLLVTLLSKLSNFIPGAGIWMNTQRPEWNDANNALVGYGVSMVTTYYIRAYLRFCLGLFEELEIDSLSISEEVATLLEKISHVLSGSSRSPEKSLEDSGMKDIMDSLGQAGSDFRQEFYRGGLSGGRSEITIEILLDFFHASQEYIDVTIKANRREDKLYHSYNLMQKEEGGQIKVRRLYEMLEGQVAILASGFLSAHESVELLDALKSSALFREDQYSYILYPNRRLPLFMEKNTFKADMMERSQLLQNLLDAGNKQIVSQDVNGDIHFNGDFRNASMLNDALDHLPGQHSKLLKNERRIILDLFEEIFDHQSFTGRSGTFYGYEGLGSIYWHMVSKLLLAVGDTYHRATLRKADEPVLGRLAAHYYEIRAGIGLNKNPKLYGAFPTDPYSHTPGGRGVQQPGMTGQVKEDILSRWRELGIMVEDGRIHFTPILLRRQEFLHQKQEFIYYNVDGAKKAIELDQGSLAFTYCQVPVIYRLSGENKIHLTFSNGSSEEIKGDALNEDQSASVFNRKGKISRIEVWLEPLL